jgi:hypothetical protein
LCAVHTLNNLLQLTTEAPSRQNTHVVTRQEWMLINDHLYDYNDDGVILNTAATKEEFDILADTLTQKEQYLMKEMFVTSSKNEVNRNYVHDIPDSDDGLSQEEKLSLWGQLRSNHRSLFTGNYSLEVRNFILKVLSFPCFF